MPSALDLTGQRFGRLVVIAKATLPPPSTGNRSLKWEARCSCGRTVLVRATSLRTGNTTSCGCSRTKHGQSRTGLYQLWSSMIRRCELTTSKDYPHYGARGIKVYTEWRVNFEAFAKDMGPRPTNRHTIDRRDSNGDYEPANCRWATMTVQQRNKRNNRRIQVGDVIRTMSEWSETSGIPQSTIAMRLRRGWSNLRAVTVPPRHGSVLDRAPT